MSGVGNCGAFGSSAHTRQSPKKTLELRGLPLPACLTALRSQSILGGKQAPNEKGWWLKAPPRRTAALTDAVAYSSSPVAGLVPQPASSDPVATSTASTNPAVPADEASTAASSSIPRSSLPRGAPPTSPPSHAAHACFLRVGDSSSRGRPQRHVPATMYALRTDAIASFEASMWPLLQPARPPPPIVWASQAPFVGPPSARSAVASDATGPAVCSVAAADEGPTVAVGWSVQLSADGVSLTVACPSDAAHASPSAAPDTQRLCSIVFGGVALRGAKRPVMPPSLPPAPPLPHRLEHPQQAAGACAGTTHHALAASTAHKAPAGLTSDASTEGAPRPVAACATAPHAVHFAADEGARSATHEQKTGHAAESQASGVGREGGGEGANADEVNAKDANVKERSTQRDNHGLSPLLGTMQLTVGTLELLDERCVVPAAQLERATLRGTDADKGVGDGVGAAARAGPPASSGNAPRDAEAAAAIGEASAEPPWVELSPIGLRPPGSPQVLVVRLNWTRPSRAAHAELLSDTTGASAELEIAARVSQLKLPVKPIMIVQMAETMAPLLSQAIAIAAVRARDHGARNPKLPQVTCPVSLSLEVDMLQLALPLPSGNQLLSSHTIAAHARFFSSTQEQIALAWQLNASLCPAAPSATFAPKLAVLRALRPSVAAGDWWRGDGHRDACAAATSEAVAATAALLARAQPLLPHCSFRLTTELVDTHGMEATQAARAHAREVPIGLGRAAARTTRVLKRTAQLQLRRCVVLAPPAHVLAMTHRFSELRTSLAIPLHRLERRTAVLRSLLASPPPPAAVSTLDVLPVVLPGSPALEPATLSAQLDHILLSACPPSTADEGASRWQAVQRALRESKDASDRQRPRPTMHLVVRVRRVRIFLCDDFTAGARNDPVMEAHLPKGFVVVTRATTPARAVQCEGAISFELRGFSQRARLWEPLVERTLVKASFSSDPSHPIMGHWDSNRTAAAEATTTAAAEATTTAAAAAPRSGGTESEEGAGGAAEETAAAQLRIILPKRCNITVTQQYLRLIRLLHSYLQSASAGYVPPVGSLSVEQMKLDRAVAIEPPSSPSSPFLSQLGLGADGAGASNSTIDAVGGTPWAGKEVWVVNELGATVWLRSPFGGAHWALPAGCKVRLGRDVIVLPAEGDSHGHVAAVRTPGLSAATVKASTHDALGFSFGDGAGAAKGGDRSRLLSALKRAAGRNFERTLSFDDPRDGRDQASEAPTGDRGVGATSEWRWDRGWGAVVLRGVLKQLRRVASWSAEEIEARVWRSASFSERRAAAAEEAVDSDEATDDNDDDDEQQQEGREAALTSPESLSAAVARAGNERSQQQQRTRA